MEWLSSPVSLGKSCHTPSLAWQLSPEVARSSSAPSTTSRAKDTGLKLGSILCTGMVFMKEACAGYLPCCLLLGIRPFS